MHIFNPFWRFRIHNCLDNFLLKFEVQVDLLGDSEAKS